MSKSNRLFCAAIGGFLVAFSVAADGHAQRDQTAPPALKNKTIGAEPYQPGCSNPTDREDANFCEQQRAAEAAQQSVFWAGEQANWAKEQAVWAERQTYIGAAGLFGVIVSLLLSGWAAIAATRAAEGTNDANKVARAIHEAEQRPWLSVEPELASSFVFEDQGGEITINFKMKNFGQSPALNVMLEARLVLTNDPTTAEDALKGIMANQERYYDGLKPAYRGVVGDTRFPGEKATAVRRLSINDDVVRKYAGGRTDIGIAPILIGSVSYRSAVSPGKVHHTGFVYDLVKPMKDGSGLSVLIGVHDHIELARDLELQRSLVASYIA